MITFLNIIILCLALMIMPDFYDKSEITLFSITLLLSVGLVFEIVSKVVIFFNGRYYYDNSDLRIYDDYYKQNALFNNHFYPIKCGKKKKTFIYHYENENNNVLEELENKCKIKDSRIEILNYTDNIHKRIEELKYKTKLIECKSDIKVNEENKVTDLIPIKQIVLDKLNKENKSETIEFSNKPRLTVKLEEEKEDKTSNSKAKDVIMIVNDYEVDNNRKGAYNTIIDLFKKKKYATSKFYRLLRSIQYIDLLPTSINLYINYAELDNIDEIPMIEIREALRESMHCKDLQVLFLNYKHTNIFEYYLMDKLVYNE